MGQYYRIANLLELTLDGRVLLAAGLGLPLGLAGVGLGLPLGGAALLAREPAPGGLAARTGQRPEGVHVYVGALRHGHGRGCARSRSSGTRDGVLRDVR